VPIPLRPLARGLLAAALLAAPPVAAEDAFAGKKAGDLMVRLRGIYVSPEDSAQIDPIGGDTQISSEYAPEIDFTYFLLDQIALELVLTTTRHNVKVKDSSIGDVDIGKISLLPPTLLLQWHPLPGAKISPYVGGGVNYNVFYDQKTEGIITDADYDDTVGYAVQAGVDVHLIDKFWLNLDVKKYWIDTRAKFNGGTITADVDLDPWLFGVGIGYKF
jgi:outer membrane protein